MLEENIGVAVAELLQEARGTLDIGEQEGDGALWQRDHDGTVSFAEPDSRSHRKDRDGRRRILPTDRHQSGRKEP